MSTSQCATLVSLVQQYPGHATGFYADRAGMASRRCCALLTEMARRGWVVADLAPSGVKGKYVWTATDKLRRGGYPTRSFDTEARVRAYLSDGRSVSLRDLSKAVDRLYDSVKKAVRRMAERGDVETYIDRGALYVRLPLVDEDDGWTPPTNYIGGTRAVILGLRRAA